MRLEIGDEVSDADRETATLGIKAMHDYADSLGAVSDIEGEISFYVYQNLDELVRAYTRVTGISEENARDDWEGPNGHYNGVRQGVEHVFVYMLGDYNIPSDSEKRIAIFAEYLYEAYRGKIRERSESCHLEYALRWLWDGARKFALKRALATDATSYNDERERIAIYARSTDTPLEEMATRRIFGYGDFMAAELLASRAGESALMRYYALFPQKGAFHASFGMTLDEFYELFNAHKDAGFPKLDIPKTAPIPEPPPTAPESGSAAVAPPYIAWNMGEGVLWEDKFYAVCGTRIMHDYATSLGMPEMKRTFTASAEYEYTPYSYLSGLGGSGIDATLYGLPHNRIYSTIGMWAHELVHVFQYELSEKWSLQPAWLAEGSAEFLADRAMLNSGALHSEERRWVVERANRIDNPLRELETHYEFLDKDAPYSYAHMAAELLASRAGEGAILRYYALLTRGTDWRDAFESAFGLTVDDFYVLFEAHRAAGFPVLEIPAVTFTPTPIPTPTNASTHFPVSYVRLEIGDEVSNADREAATLGIKAMHDYADSLGAVSDIEGEISFYVYQNFDELVRAFARVTGISEEDAMDEWVSRSGDYFSDQKGIGRVFVHTLGDYYANRDSEERVEIFAEYLYEAYRGKIRERSESCHLEYAPRWLWDGARNFALERAQATDATSYDNERERIARRAISLDRSLREMETWPKIFQRWPTHMMAAELLASRAGESALMRYYALFPQRGAFQTAFGMTLNEFYELFDAHKDAGFPKLDIPKTAPIPEPPPTAPEPERAAVAPPYISWEMGDGVLWEDNLYAVCGTRIMHDYAMSLGMPEMKRTFTASAEYRYGSGFGSGVQGFGGSRIYIYLIGLPHTRIYSTLSVWAHELVHVFQYQLSEKSLHPAWLTEGSAEFLADRAMLNSGALHSAERRWVVERANRIDKPLRDIETRDDFRDKDDLGSKYYPYSHMAAELLASRAGEGAILRYYALLTRGTDWRDAFESAFGLTVDDFYVLFEAHRAAGFPALEIPASAP